MTPGTARAVPSVQFAALQRQLEDADAAVLGGRFNDAEHCLQDALALARQLKGDESEFWRAAVGSRFAMLLAQLDRAEEAERCLIDIINGIESSRSGLKAQLATLYHQLGLLYRQDRRIKEAMRVFDTALSLLPASGSFRQRAATLMGRGLAATQLQQQDVACASFLQAIVDLDRASAAPSRWKLEACICAAGALIQSGRYAEAEELCRQALELRALITYDGHDEAGLWNMLGFCFARRNRVDESVQAYRTALEILASTELPNARELGDSHFNLALLYAVKKQCRESDLHLRQAADIIDRDASQTRLREEHFRKVFFKHFEGEQPHVETRELADVLLFSSPIPSGA